MPLPKHHPTACRTFLGSVAARWLGIIGTLICPLFAAFGQEALRASLAGEAAVEAQKKAIENQYYNLQMGDLKLRFQTALGVEATDNVNYSEKNRQADVSLRPQLDVTAMFPLTDRNTIALTIGAGYAKYVKTKARNHFFLTPDSTIGFNIYAGDFVFNLHTQFTYTEDSYQQSEITGGSYGYFQNMTGVNATWDLNKLILTFGIDHEIYTPTQPQYSYQARSSELVNARAVYLINPTTQLGLQLGASVTAFDTKPGYTNIVGSVYLGTNFLGYITNTVPAYQFLSNQKSVNFGPYFQSRLSEHLRLTISAGYAIYFQEAASYFAKGGDSAAYYADIQLQHAVNARVAYSLNVGHQVRQGLTTDSLDYYYFHLNPTWQVFSDLTLSAPLSIESYTSTGYRAEKYQFWNLGLSASCRLSKKLTLTGSYNYRMRDSNLVDSDYVENQLVLDTRYSF